MIITSTKCIGFLYSCSYFSRLIGGFGGGGGGGRGGYGGGGYGGNFADGAW